VLDSPVSEPILHVRVRVWHGLRSRRHPTQGHPTSCRARCPIDRLDKKSKHPRNRPGRTKRRVRGRGQEAETCGLGPTFDDVDVSLDASVLLCFWYSGLLVSIRAHDMSFKFMQSNWGRHRVHHRAFSPVRPTSSRSLPALASRLFALPLYTSIISDMQFTRSAIVFPRTDLDVITSSPLPIRFFHLVVKTDVDFHS
jgi:hypothetical protein